MKRFILLVCLTAIASARAQKNVTKINLGDALIKSYSISQERAVFKRSSVQLSLKFMPLAKVSGIEYTRIWYPNPDRNPLLGTKMSAKVAALEYRIYRNHKALNSFYWGFSLNAAQYQLSTGTFTTTFNAPANFGQYQALMQEYHIQVQQEYQVQLQQEYQATLIGAGLEIGIQKKIGKHVFVDWTILGLGIGHASMKGQIHVASPDVADFDLRMLDMNTFDTHCKAEDYVTIEKTINAQSISLSSKAWVPTFHMGLAIGIGY